MPKLKPVHVKLTERQIRDLARIGEDSGVDRSNLIRLAVARFIDEEKQRSKAPRKTPSVPTRVI